MSRIATIFILAFCVLASCKKYEDKVGNPDERLNNSHYCNDPEAVNYNWGFPGVPDNTICLYPTHFFGGKYTLVDTIYYSNEFKLARVDTLTIQLDSINRQFLQFRAVGSNNVWCTDKFLTLTADRFFRANVDSLILPDSVKLNGQVYCRNDTISGSITTSQNDPMHLHLDFTVISDTGSGLTFHKGTATKQ